MSRYSLLLLCLNFLVIQRSFAYVWDEESDNYHVERKRGIINYFKNSISFKPEIQTNFYLYTPEGLNIPRWIRFNDTKSLTTSHFSTSRPTRFIIHGWMNGVNANVNEIVREAYMKNGNFNIFVVDWAKGAAADYTMARRRVDDVGSLVARFIDFLYQVTKVDFDSIYLIGHSLGAHVAGCAGRYVQYGKIPVIFALDPALPLFTNPASDGRISSLDATYIESIHTSSGYLGFLQPVGHASFYPNYGFAQKGCSLLNQNCHHGRSYRYFAESISPESQFFAKGCKNWAQIVYDKECDETGEVALMGGEPAQTNRSGVFYLPTNSKSPFWVGKF